MMTAYVQSSSMATKQALIGPGDNVAIDINGVHYPVNFVTNGGQPAGQFNGPTITLENIGSSLGGAIQFQVPVNGSTKKLNIVVVEYGQGATAYRLITWSLY